MFPDKFRLSISKKDLTDCNYTSNNDCAVARAFRRKFNLTKSQVNVGSEFAYVTDGVSYVSYGFNDPICGGLQDHIESKKPLKITMRRI
jgi:hypothetical protein